MATTTESDNSLEALRRGVEANPGDLDLRTELARALHAKRRFPEAIREARTVLAGDPGNVAAWLVLGRSQNNSADLTGAKQSFRRATELDPSCPEAWHGLGHVCRAGADAVAARDAFLKALQLAPEFARAHHDLATVYNDLGQPDLAVDHFRRGLGLDGDNPVGWVNLGDLLHVNGNLAEAEDCYRKALLLAPDYPDALAALATLLQGRNDHDEAEVLFERALAAQPDNAVALAGLAWHLELHGEPVRALALIERGPGPSPTPELLSVHARLLRRADREEEAIAMLEPWQRDAADGHPVPIHLLFVLADLYDKKGDYDRAFDFYRLGNERRKARFDASRYRDQVSAQMRFFSGTAFDSMPMAGRTGIRPVFVVGMPRSGTSLVEQILAAHPAVMACGERDTVFRLAGSLARDEGSYPDCIAALTSRQLNEYAADYLYGAGAPGPDIAWITDKLPANFLHLGLISRLFPGARVIHCRRDPMDTGLSCYRQNFKSSAMSFSHDLTDIAAYILEYRKMMMHWAEVLPLPLLDLRYEELIDDQEGWTRRLIGFLDLPWDARCLRFYEIDRVVNTASYEQARKPVFRTSVGHWRHYEHHLQPLRDAIGYDS